jgi:hypothetical protein
VIAELEQVTFRRLPNRPNAQGGLEVWEMVSPDGNFAFAQAEIYPAEVQWGVRIRDRAPGVEDGDLVKLTAKLLVWHVACKAETVEVWLARNNTRHALVRVGGDYV